MNFPLKSLSLQTICKTGLKGGISWKNTLFSVLQSIYLGVSQTPKLKEKKKKTSPVPLSEPFRFAGRKSVTPRSHYKYLSSFLSPSNFKFKSCRIRCSSSFFPPLTANSARKKWTNNHIPVHILWLENQTSNFFFSPQDKNWKFWILICGWMTCPFP